MLKEIALPEGVTLAATSLILPKNLPFEKWEIIGSQLKTIEGSVLWWVGDWLKFGESKYGEKYAQAIDATERNYSTIADAKWVANRIEFSRRRENLSWSHHREVAALEPDQQDHFLDIAAAENLSRSDLRKLLFHDKLQNRHREISKREKVEAKKRQYALIYADPPWKFDTYSELGKEMTSPDLHYPTLDMTAINDLKVWDRSVNDLAFADAGLFLWCTSANFEKALGIVRAWGFEYKTHAVWDKQRTGTGYIFMNQHEPLIYASRGKFPMPLEKFSSMFSYPRGEHSAKPVEVRRALEQMYPDFTEDDRIELFARGDIPGWTTWGNEAE